MWCRSGVLLFAPLEKDFHGGVTALESPRTDAARRAALLGERVTFTGTLPGTIHRHSLRGFCFADVSPVLLTGREKGEPSPVLSVEVAMRKSPPAADGSFPLCVK